MLKLPDPPVTVTQLPPPELELLLDDELELEELLDDELLLEEELELLDDELLLDEELDELELLDELEPALIWPAEAVNVTLSSFAPSSRRSTLSV